MRGASALHWEKLLLFWDQLLLCSERSLFSFWNQLLLFCNRTSALLWEELLLFQERSLFSSMRGASAFIWREFLLLFDRHFCCEELLSHTEGSLRIHLRIEDTLWINVYIENPCGPLCIWDPWEVFETIWRVISMLNLLWGDFALTEGSSFIRRSSDRVSLHRILSNRYSQYVWPFEESSLYRKDFFSV